MCCPWNVMTLSIFAVLVIGVKDDDDDTDDNWS